MAVIIVDIATVTADYSDGLSPSRLARMHHRMPEVAHGMRCRRRVLGWMGVHEASLVDVESSFGARIISATASNRGDPRVAKENTVLIWVWPASSIKRACTPFPFKASNSTREDTAVRRSKASTSPWPTTARGDGSLRCSKALAWSSNSGVGAYAAYIFASAGSSSEPSRRL